MDDKDMTYFARRFIYVMIGSAFFLSACGVKGDLSMPEKANITDNIMNSSQ
ncbi:hypothetical protein IMCC14465_15390 [alpha proteobacterium IMCC14465]|uniref:Lipoprotein n=1 Tax=alpha proteobacterium IMCC14465 TaxID=1220535 RepID=J9DUH6_9PROT|nr:hypothetical protein IMCC14465_15390 [alpha proteobacterium IMCC14465]